MIARIFRPAKTAMQSGKARTQDWVLEFAPASARVPDPLMGWTLTDDTSAQVRLSFDTRDEAIAYAQRHGLAFQVTEPKAPRRILKAYADNFSADRKQPWTH
jgi:hypothetical protein